MLDFKKEVSKYEPLLETEDIEKAINSDEIQDVMDLLQHITKRISEDGKKR